MKRRTVWTLKLNLLRFYRHWTVTRSAVNLSDVRVVKLLHERFVSRSRAVISRLYFCEFVPSRRRELSSFRVRMWSNSQLNVNFRQRFIETTRKIFDKKYSPF